MSYRYHPYGDSSERPYVSDTGNWDGDVYGSPPENTYPEARPPLLRPWFDVSNHLWLKGFLLGAAATVIVSNPTVQRGIIRSVVTIWSSFQGGVEEIKEQIKDVKAEMGQT